MSVDSQRVADFINFSNGIWATPMQFGIAMYLLWQQVGMSALGGITFLCVLIPFNIWVSKRIRAIQSNLMREKDVRTKWMNEILNGIKVLKLYAWEKPFVEQIYKYRENESRHLFSMAYLIGFISFAFQAAPLIVGILTFSLYVLSGGILDPNKAFVSLSLFNILRIPMGTLPMMISVGSMAIIAVQRINKYLNLPEIDDSSITSLPHHEYAIQLKDTTFTWSENKDNFLKDISLDIVHGKLIAIVGTVGSGKTSLLSGILGDMQKVAGKANVDGKIAYVPQQAWMQNATIRKNILFTRPYEDQKYKKTLQACCLEPDLQILTGGDLTEIGEKGINLSGGQKQRISIARAVYSNASIILMDDPLSAVDANVSKQLFENVISNNGLLRNKTRVLVTNRVACLPDVDEIIVMKDGQISERGSLTELVNSKGAFADFIAEYLEQIHNQDQDSDDLIVEHPELIKSLVERVKPILERSKSRTKSGSTVTSDSDKMNEVYRKSLEKSANLSLFREKLAHEKAQREVKKQASGQLIKEEFEETGGVKFSVYFKYLKTIGWLVSSCILLGMVSSNVFQVLQALWLSEWSNDALDPARAFDETLRNIRLIGYGGYGLGSIVCSLTSTVCLNIACIRASLVLHNEMMRSVLFSPMSFFDTTPIGRILNRFTKDVDTADFSIVFNLRMSVSMFFSTIVAFVMISLEASIILVALLPVFVFYVLIQRLYIATSRQLKRIESTTRSPIYNHFTETVHGVTSIRAYNVQDKFIVESNNRIDSNNSAFHASFTASRWLSIRLEFFGYSIVCIAALFAVFNKDTLTAGLAGLAISYSLNITTVVSMFIRCITDLESNIVSIERLIEYSELEPEAEYFKPFDPLPRDWPTKGEIQLINYSTRYRPGMSLILSNITAKIEAGEKVGIVGRTGAGKSSLTLGLFRIIEAASGQILIDNVDISQLGLFDLRSRLTIIPQDPVLFTGTLRLNLDPFNRHTDDVLWNALEMTNLKKYVLTLSEGLMYKIVEGGENLSVGQRQLICLARALLRKTKILILDEATAGKVPSFS